MATVESDLLIIGGGPAGLSAAINGASEGLSVSILDAHTTLGGQAIDSQAIENYPGFPDGITGLEMMSRFIDQAHKFSALPSCPVDVVDLRVDGKRYIATAADYREFAGRVVLFSLGLTYRKLEVAGISRFMGRGVSYGMPSGPIKLHKGDGIVIVGGANSAGQAACHFAKNKNITVHLVCRRTLDDGMSTYLVNRLRSAPNVIVHERTEIESLERDGSGCLSAVYLQNNFVMVPDPVPAKHLMIYIGAMPRTRWLRNIVQLDEHKFILTGSDVVAASKDFIQQWMRTPLPFETSLGGVFAAGDVRSGSTKRIAAAVGEGGAALQTIHRYRSMMNGE